MKHVSFSRIARAALVAAIICAATAPSPSFADGLPAGYTQVPFLKANGSCQVRTGLTPTSTDKVEMSWRPIRVDTTETLWCSRSGSGSTGQFTCFQISNKIRIDRNEGTAGQKTSAAALLAGTNYTIVADYAAGTCVVTNTAANAEALSVAMGDTAAYTAGSELCLFGSHTSNPDTKYGNPAYYRLYSFKLKASDGTVKCDLVPARRDADGVLGLYDLARPTTFLTNCLSGVFTTQFTEPITPSDPLWGKTLTIGDDVIIDAGDGATWQGAITVYEGGTLQTRGNLNVAGTTAINADGTVVVETGTSHFTFAANAIKGNLTVNAGAELEMNANEAFQGAATIVFHLYGTLNVAGTRQRMDGGKFFFHDGSRVTGTGDDYGGLYAYRNSRIVFDGTVEIEPPVAIFNAYTLTAACCENARVTFKDGFKAYGSNQKTGLFVQESATAEEGNASETCANAFIEIAPCSYSGAYYYTGSMSFVSNAKIALGDPNDYTVTSTGASLEFVADKATALANHATAQTLPAITADATSASLPTVRLTGDGTVALRDAAPAFPIEFAGPSLVIADNAPVALAAGSSVTAPTTVGVEGLAAGTAATLFTGADSAFDVSKVSVKPAHNGVLFGTAATASLSGTDVTTAGLPAYDPVGWVEPYIKANALVWLDASDAANFVFKDNTFGLVETWKDKSAYKRDASAYTIASHDPNWGSLAVTNGVPAYCMGDVNSGIDLAYEPSMSVRTAFFAMSIRQTTDAFWLGYTGGYPFHRGSNGTYSYKSGGNQNNTWYCDGVQVANTQSDKVPTDRHVYSVITAAASMSNRLTLDRNSGNSIRHGGRELSELIAFDTPLSDADRQAIEAYLAAKWMGANPSAAGTDGTYAVSGEMEVDGTLGGGKNLDFAEGASVSVTNPSSTEPMLSTTGAVTIPAGTTLAVSVDAAGLVPGTYTVMQAASGITSLSQFDATATVGAGATATFAVVDGKLTMTIAASSSVASQTWRPQSAADLGWNATSANWLYDGGATGGFIGYVPAFIDGAETATGDITVTGTQTAGPITITGAKDYTFAGDGTLAGGETVTFGGTGTVTLDGASFGDQTIVVTNGQKVVLGFNASQNALGTDSGSTGGKVEIAQGSQFNINYTGFVNGNADPRAEITQLKTFSIAGDGPDGRGALVNDALDGRATHTYYNAMLRRVELADDATIGGTDRVDIRARTGTDATATPGLYGPGKTLTVKNEQCFCILSQPIDVGAIVVPTGGFFLPANLTESAINIPGGITIDGGTVNFYNTTYPATMPVFVTANGGTFKPEGGASTVKGDVTVASGAALAITGDKDITFSGAFNAVGATITHSGSASTYFKGPSSGTLDITKTAGSVYIGSGFSNSVVNITQSNGNCGLYTEATAPIFDTLNFDSTAGGSIYIQSQSTSTLIDVPGTVNLNAPVNNTLVFGPTGNKGFKLKMTGSTTGLFAGINSSRPGTLYLKSGTDLSVNYLGTGGNNTSPSQGEIVIESGAKVTVGKNFLNAYKSGVPGTPATHRIDIYGEVDAPNIDYAYITYDGVRGETYLHDGGVFKPKRLAGTHLTTLYPYGTGVGAGDGRQWFVMDGGRLEFAGISASALPGCTKFDFQNGTVVNTASYGTSQGVPVFFGYETLGGEVEFNLPSSGYVNLNTGLSGASAVTVKGNGYIGGTRAGAVWQGALLGKLTLENTSATASDLCNASVFAGGLALADGVKAKVGKYADTLYPFAVSIASKVSNREKLATNDWSYAYGAADGWGYLHKYYKTPPYGTYASQAMRCEFYVPEEKAGTWTFCGEYDDYLFVQIDGEAVFNHVYTAAAAHQVALSAGWHKLVIATYDSAGSCGAIPSSSAYQNGWGDKTFGFIIGESSSTAGGDYTKFEPGASLGDDLTLQVRPAVNACVWSHSATKPTSATFRTMDDWTHVKCIDSVEYLQMTGSNAAADTLGFFSTKFNCFEGWFRVEDDKAGEWRFKMAYDDFHQLKIDGKVVLNQVGNSSEVMNNTVTLTAGWHRWEARVGDSGGAWGPRSYNGGKTLTYIAPGETEKRFDETNLKLAATLGDIAVLEPSGIYKDLELGAGATLTSSGTMAMPIYGTLKGTGELAGSWEFAGESNCFEVTNAVAKNADLPVATFAAATPATFAGLKNVKVTFDGKPSRSTYYLTGAIDGLTAASLPSTAITVKDSSGGDYSANFTLTVKNGRLALSNSKPACMIIIVR